MASDSMLQPEEPPIIRIGMLRLSDAAPVVMALEKAFFEGLDVRLFVEPSWANVADKLAFGHLDAAVMLPPLALAMALGIRGAPSPVIVPMGLSLNGNSFTVSHEIADAIGSAGTTNAMETGGRLCAWLKTSSHKPRFAVVHTFSTHNLLLRYWLAAAAIDPDKDVEIVILPPAETANALKGGEIDGFCAGAPWGSVAAASGAGRSVLTSSEIWRDHPEKCLAVGHFAERQPQLLTRLLSALLRAARYCDEPRNAEEIAAILGRAEYLDVDPALIRESLPAFSCRDRSVFAAHAANTPFHAHALWFLSQMTRWGYVSRGTDPALAELVYRADLLPADAVVTREPEQFCDGVIFNPPI